MKNVRQKRIDVRTLKLSAEEGFVLSRVEGPTTLRQLIALTGLEESRVEQILERLSEQGAVEVDADLSRDENPSATTGGPAETSPALAEAGDGERAGTSPALAEAAGGPAGAPLPTAGEDAQECAPASSEPDRDVAEDPAVVEHDRQDEAMHRRAYASVYQAMLPHERMRAAHAATGSDLLALCLDPDPQVVHAVLTNPSAGLDHARLIASHHRTHIGLEAVVKRADHLNDAVVQRRLLRNPQLPGTILHRILNPRLMIEVYKICVDRENPERSRAMTRDVLRKKFVIASSDEKASLLSKTEGRCLALLADCGLDAHATQILCSKQTYTVVFIQNLSRWPATPPALLAHMLKMQIVRRNAGLRKMVLKHPNAPADSKRSS